MALEYSLDTLDGLDESVSALYKKQNDGKFLLDVSGAPEIPDVSGLKTALEAERERNKDRKKWEALGKTPDEIQELLNAQAKLEEDAAKKRGDFDAIRKQDQAKWDKEREGFVADNAKMAKVERDAVIKNGLTTALAAAGFTNEGLALLPNQLSARIKIEEVDGVRETRIYQADGETLMAGSGKSGVAGFEDLAKEAAEAFPSLVSGKGGGGGGKPPNSKNGSDAKTIPIAEFDAMSPNEQAKTIADGISPVDPS